MIKFETLKNALERGLIHFDLQRDVSLVEVKNETRLVLSVVQNPQYPPFGHAMIKLERWLKTFLDVEDLELQLESKEDRNRRVERSGRTKASAS